MYICKGKQFTVNVGSLLNKCSPLFRHILVFCLDINACIVRIFICSLDNPFSFIFLLSQTQMFICLICMHKGNLTYINN